MGMSFKKINFINDASIAIYHIFVDKSVATILPGVFIIRLSNDYKISLLLKASDDSAVAFRILANLLLFSSKYIIILNLRNIKMQSTKLGFSFKYYR